MKKSEITDMLDNLLFYHDVEITHRIGNFHLMYSVGTREFIIEDARSGERKSFRNKEDCTAEMERIINNAVENIAE
ncbi:MAG: hypothetical protein ACI4XL_12625 [Bacillus sp. (in: firmicutes)]